MFLRLKVNIITMGFDNNGAVKLLKDLQAEEVYCDKLNTLKYKLNGLIVEINPYCAIVYFEHARDFVRIAIDKITDLSVLQGQINLKTLMLELFEVATKVDYYSFGQIYQFGVVSVVLDINYDFTNKVRVESDLLKENLYVNADYDSIMEEIQRLNQLADKKSLWHRLFK